MRTIRENVFETNSSSSHSISLSDPSISNDGMMDTIPLNGNGDIVLSGGEFGWQWEKFSDALTKANYCAVYAVLHRNDLINQLIEVIKDQTGANNVILDISDDCSKSNWSYIDHDSFDVAAAAFGSNDVLRRFIFNRKSILYLGNDNEIAPDMFYEPKVRYTHRVIIPDLKRLGAYATYHLENPDNDRILLAIEDILYNEIKDGVKVDQDRNLIEIVDYCSSYPYMSYGDELQYVRNNLIYKVERWRVKSKGFDEGININENLIRLFRQRVNDKLQIEPDPNDYIDIKYEVECL